MPRRSEAHKLCDILLEEWGKRERYVISALGHQSGAIESMAREDGRSRRKGGKKTKEGLPVEHIKCKETRVKLPRTPFYKPCPKRVMKTIQVIDIMPPKIQAAIRHKYVIEGDENQFTFRGKRYEKSSFYSFVNTGRDMLSFLVKTEKKERAVT